MADALQRLLSPRRLAVAGGAWAEMVLAGNQRLGFTGELYHIHPRAAISALADLPAVPDCAAIGVSHEKTVAMMRELAEKGAGGAVCFASGFAELNTDEGRARTGKLLEAAGDMPFLGPNCYGFINYLDRVAVWPDQIGGEPVERGVTLICQSGAVAFTLMSQQRSLPIAHLISIGNQARVKVHDLIRAAASDDRVTAIGLYIEGVPDVAEFISAVLYARSLNKPIALIKSGRTEAASRVALTHTASLSGADKLYQALFDDLGIARCVSLAELVETLKLFHGLGPIAPKGGVLISGCSGGDMAMTADLADGLDIDFTPIPEAKLPALRDILGPDVSLANPFDFQTFIWPYPEKITALFTEIGQAGYDAIGLVIDHPDPDYCDIGSYERPLKAFLKAVALTGVKASVILSLPETLPKRLRDECLAQGVVPLQGLPEALKAFHHAKRIGLAWNRGKVPKVLVTKHKDHVRTLKESDAKRRLAEAGISVPSGRLTTSAGITKVAIGKPVVLKISSDKILHKTDVGGVKVGIANGPDLISAHEAMRHLGDEFLIEEMVEGVVAEVLVGATVDPQFGPVMVLGLGGILAELLKDTAHLLFPVTAPDIRRALEGLTGWPLLTGYRGRKEADVEALIAAIVNIGKFIEAEAQRLAYFEINPLFVRAKGQGVVAVDVVIGHYSNEAS